jgi:hypothetical protein
MCDRDDSVRAVSEAAEALTNACHGLIRRSLRMVYNDHLRERTSPDEQRLLDRLQ